MFKPLRYGAKWLIYALGFLLAATLSVPYGYGQSVLSNQLNLTNGLKESTNAFLYQDSYGFVWISSLKGVHRFDGRRVRQFSDNGALHSVGNIYGDNIQSDFYESLDGDLWFATDKAINCYRRTTGAIEHFFVSKSGVTYRDSLYHIFHHESKMGQLWVKCANALFLFDTQKLTSTFIKSSTAYRFGIQTDNKTGKKKLIECFWRSGSGIKITENISGCPHGMERAMFDGHTPNELKLNVQKCFVQNDTIAWLSTDKGLVRINTDTPNGHSLHVPPDVRNTEIRSVLPFNKEYLSVCTKNDGIWLFSTTKLIFEKQLESYAPISAPPKTALTFLISNDHSLWYSIRHEGLVYGQKNQPVFRDIAFSATNSPTTVNRLEHDSWGQTWCFSKNNSILLFDQNQALSKIYKANTIDRLLLTPSAIFTIEGRTVKCRSIHAFDHVEWEIPPFPTDPICIVSVKNAHLFIGTLRGIFLIDKKNKKYTPVESYKHSSTILFVDSKDRLWSAGGLSISVLDVRVPNAPKFIQSFSEDRLVNHIYEDLQKKTIIVSTSKGIRLFDSETLKDLESGAFDNMPEKYVQATVIDRLGNWWHSTKDGLVKSSFEKGDGVPHFLHYRKHNGVNGKEFIEGAALIDTTGKIWFGSTTGVDVFDPKLVKPIGQAPQLAIVGLKIHEHDWLSPDGTCIEMAEYVELEHNQNTLRLELAAMEFTNPEKNEFKVRLLNNGTDTSWIHIGTQNFITYPNLRPGKYTFQFTACNAGGIWQEAPKTLVVQINKHFTQTWWFRSAIMGFLLTVIGFGTAFYYRYQLRAQQLTLEKQQREAERKQLLLEKELSLQQERNRIADEMHDELGGGLSTIRLASQRAKRSHSPEELKSVLDRVSQISIALVGNMRGIIWAMDSQNDSLRSLVAYIRQYAVTFLDDNRISAVLDFPENIPELPLNSQYRHNIVLTVKECLNNILKHAEASHVRLSATFDDYIEIKIQDDGKTFDPSEHIGKGKGLRTTVKRIESLGGQIQWAPNEADIGMCVTISVPLPTT